MDYLIETFAMATYENALKSRLTPMNYTAKETIDM